MAVCVAAFVVLAGPAWGNTGDLDPGQSPVVELPSHLSTSSMHQEFLIGLGVPEGQVAALLSSPEREPVLAATRGAEPVRTIHGQGSSFSVALYVYDDGSVHSSIVQVGPVLDRVDYLVEGPGLRIDVREAMEALPRTGMSTSGVSGCDALPNLNGWIRRADCTVYDSMTPPIISGWFQVNYSVKSGAGRIDGNPWGEGMWCIDGYPTGEDIRVVRRLSSGSTPAQVYHDAYCDVSIPYVPSYYIWHKLKVRTSAWTEH